MCSVCRRDTTEVPTPKREHPMPGNEIAQIDFGAKDYGDEESTVIVDDLDKANAILSRMDLPPGIPVNYHRPVLDIDIPAKLVPSSTPGHSHLYIDKPMEWSKYVKLLDVLVEVGILEQGYAEGARRAGYTTLRLPWVSK